jgi:hypothetical protein
LCNLAGSFVKIPLQPNPATLFLREVQAALLIKLLHLLLRDFPAILVRLIPLVLVSEVWTDSRIDQVGGCPSAAIRVNAREVTFDIRLLERDVLLVPSPVLFGLAVIEDALPNLAECSAYVAV